MQKFQPQRIVKESILNIEASPQKIFPMLCPVREYEWVEPWQCDLLYSESGVAENNCIFETDFAYNSGRETWIVSRYDPDRCIEFVRFTAGEKVVKLDIRLTAVGDHTTRLLWRKIYTGLSHNGNRIIHKIAEEQFAAEAAKIEQMLNHFMATGQMLRPETPG